MRQNGTSGEEESGDAEGAAVEWFHGWVGWRVWVCSKKEGSERLDEVCCEAVTFYGKGLKRRLRNSTGLNSASRPMWPFMVESALLRAVT